MAPVNGFTTDNNMQNKNKLYFSNQLGNPRPLRDNSSGAVPKTATEVHNQGLPNFQTSKVSNKGFGTVKAFAANTNVGLVRQYNEDRIAIILNVIHPPNKKPIVNNWPNIQIFGVYDGHGGS